MIEREIVMSVYSEKMYSMVSFLEPNDFFDKKMSFYWGLIQKFDGNVIKLLGDLEFNKKKEYLNEVRLLSTGMGTTRLQELALVLIEIRFKRLYLVLIDNILQSVDNALESSLLIEIKTAVDKQDIFLLSNSAIDYIGSQCSAPTKKRLGDFIDYRNKRMEEIKIKLNGIR